MLHVIDSSSEDMHEQIQAVKDVLAEISNDVPVLNVYNKIDLTDEPAHIGYASVGQPNRVYVSSRENLGMEELSLAVQQLLTGTLTTFDLTLPYHAGQLKNALYELGVIQEESYDDSGHECNDSLAKRYAKTATGSGKFNTFRCIAISTSHAIDAST